MQKTVRNSAIFLAAILSIHGSSAIPLFIEVPTYQESVTDLKALNDAGDILANAEVENGSAYNDGPVLVRDGEARSLFPTGTPNLNSVIASALSERRPDGSVYVAGTAIMKDGFWRAALWDIAADGSIRSFRTMPNIILPEDSSAPGEQGKSYGVAVNTAGVLVGSGNSYLASVATIWRPPYGQAVRYLLSTGSEFSAIREDELLLANGVEFDHGSSNNRYAAAVLHEGGIPQEVPLLYGPAGLRPNQVVSMRGDWLAGINQGDNHSHAFAWKIGSARSVELLAPAEWVGSDRQARVTSIAADGRAVGFPNGGSYTGLPIYWDYQNGEHVAYSLADLVPDQQGYLQADYQILNNNAGDIVFVQREWQGSRLKLFKPLTNGIISFVPSGWGDEGSRLEFKVKLLRAPGHNAQVRVNYQTEDDTATSPRHYGGRSGTLVWGPGESGEKSVFIESVDNDTIDPQGLSFHFKLSDPVGAQLGSVHEGEGYISEPYQNFVVRNQVMVDNWMQAVAVLRGEKEAVIKLQRIGNSDGSITFRDFTPAPFSSAVPGVDFIMPEGLTVTWEKSDLSVKTIRIPLLETEEPSPESKSFYLTATGRFDETEIDATISILVYIEPDGKKVRPVIDAASVRKTMDAISLSIAAMQGSIVRVEKALGSLTGWAVEAEAKSEDGEVSLELPVHRAEGAGFYRVTVQE